MLPKTTKSKAKNSSRTSVIEPPNVSIENFKLSILTELHAQVMVILFFASAFTVVLYFNITLISILEASRIFALLVSIGFLLAFFVRKRLRLSLLDGFFYNFFGIAPVGLALMLFINAQCSKTHIETYKIVDRERGGSGYTYHLENDALGDFWHIRNIDSDLIRVRSGRLQYTFCDGLFGYKVVKRHAVVN